MKVYNRHERRLKAPPETVGNLIDSLAGPDDRLWPKAKWPPMQFDRGLCPGAKGGHGPIRYHVTHHTPGERVVFQFDDSGLLKGFDGRHLYEMVRRKGHVVLRHIVDAECAFNLWLRWHLLVRPLHDALLEDSLHQAEKRLTHTTAKSPRWSLWVRLLRWIMARKGEKSNA